MKLINNTTGQHQALPEEILTKNVIAIHLVRVVREVKSADFHTLSYTWTCEFPTYFYLKPEKGAPFERAFPHPPVGNTPSPGCKIDLYYE